MAKKVIIAIIVLLVLGGGVYLLTSKKSDDNTADNSSQTSSGDTSATSSDDTKAAATITYSDSGFSPSTITVKAGDTVAIKNTSSRDIQFDSDPHPVHTDDTDLNAGAVSPGQSTIFKVDKKGTFGYHNHLNPSDTGTIIIQ